MTLLWCRHKAMRAFAAGTFFGVVFALLLAYLVAVLPLDQSIAMHSAPLSALFARVLPRAPLSVARSVLPAKIQKAFRLSNSTTVTSVPPKTFSTSAAKMGYDTLSFKEAVAQRRSIYGLQKKSSVPDAKIKEIVSQAIKDVPSSFNSQSARTVTLVKGEHDKFWETVTTILKAHVPEAQWEHTKQRMDMFAGAYGTILFYEAPEPIKVLQSRYPQYADKFPQWSEHTSAMHQYELWTALEAEGLGCNLQHYNPLPDQKASDIWGIPLEWSLKAQLVFGTPVEGAREGLGTKSEEPIEKRALFFGLDE